MKEIIYAYFTANVFIAGMYYEDGSNEGKWYQLKIVAVALLFGLMLHILEITINLIKWLWRNSGLEMNWKFYCTKQFKNLDNRQLKSINSTSEIHFKTKSLKDRRFRYWTTKINERHNYKP